MFKIIIVTAIVLLFSACSSEKNINAKSAMFQSVDEKSAILVQEGAKKRYCGRCGMDLVKYYKTSHSASYKGQNLQYCSIHCLEEHLAEGITLKNPKVIDVNSLKFISVSEAYYVVGSNIRGTMTRVSKYAFSSEEEAKKFQHINGGEIMDFHKALDITKKDFN